MTLLSVVQDVCATVGVVMPTAIFSNITGNRTMQEMVSLANEMAQRIAYDLRDWNMLKTSATFTGDGVTTEFDLPANYKRMLLTSNLWLSTSSQTPMTFIADTDEWMKRRLNSATYGTWGEWTLLGGKIHIWPVMGVIVPAWVSGVTYEIGDYAADASLWVCHVKNTPSGPGTFADYRAANPTHWAAYVQPRATFAYLDKNCINLASGGHGDRFMADGDSFALDERVLKLGMIWQWKAQKGSPYAEDMGSYGDALTNAMGADGPAPIMLTRPASSTSWGGWDGRIQ